MTLLGIQLSDILAVIAMAGTIYGLFRQGRYMQAQTISQLSQADSSNVSDALKLKAEYKADMKDVRADLEREHIARHAAESKAEEFEKKLAKMQKQIDADKILRDEAARAMAEKLAHFEAERSEYLRGVRVLINQLVELEQEPRWVPPGIEVPPIKKKDRLLK